MKIEFESIDELKCFLEDLGYEIKQTKQPMTNAEKQKAYRERKKVTDSNDTVTEVEEEEKEKKEKESTKEKEIKEKEEEGKNIYIPRAEKKAYGSAQNVMLTDDQFKKLCEKFGTPSAESKIEKASLYFASKGKAKEYKDHYMTILNWDRMDKERKAQQPQRTQNKTAYEMLMEKGLV